MIKLALYKEPSWHTRARKRRSYSRSLLQAFANSISPTTANRLDSATTILAGHHGSIPPTNTMGWSQQGKGGKAKGKGKGQSKGDSQGKGLDYYHTPRKQQTLVAGMKGMVVQQTKLTRAIEDATKLLE